MNLVVICGRLGRNPELNYTDSNVPFCTFDLAVDRPRTPIRPDVQETDWPKCVAWKGKAEAIVNQFQQGDLILVQGRIQTRMKKDPATGSKVKETEVLVISAKLQRRSVENQKRMEAGVVDSMDLEETTV